MFVLKFSPIHYDYVRDVYSTIIIRDLVEKYKDIEQFNRSITDKYVAICKRF